MSGGFFRGTTADQDTRFSNKQAKLMKSQKFPPELEHLVDMSRVKIDVVRPWIAKRVTELLGFEDEVLINFIYGLLEGKNVNGKEIQISITGFMEKNTGKFMKELWTLLLSAQKNASGVPQQFLDEKEEETKKKKADAERITNEIQKKKEREAEEYGLNQKMEGGPDTSRTNAISDKLIDSHRNGREPSRSPDDRNEIIGKNGRDRKTRNSRSSHSSGSSLSPSRRSHSRSPRGYKCSLYMERDRPSRRRSISPQFTRTRSSRRSPSLSRRRSSYRRRSRSRSRSHSLSPQRFRPASRRRSPSPVRRRSPSPVRRRSPSPVRRRSPSPFRRRSPSPVRRRSPSPFRRRSPSPFHRRSPSPVRRRSPRRRSRRSPSPLRRRSPVRSSQSPPRRGSLALVRRQSHSLVQNGSPLFSPQRASSSPSRGASPSPKQTYTSPHIRGSPSPLRHKVSPQRRRRTPSPIKHEGREQKAPASRYGRQSRDSRKHSPSDGRPFPPDQSGSETPIRQRSTSLSREKSPVHSKNLILPSSNKNHSSPNNSTGYESQRETTFRRKDVRYPEDNKKALPKELSLGSTPLISESPANRDRYPEDELRALNSSKRKESEIRKESYSQVNQETHYTRAELEKRETYFEKGINAKEADHEKGAVLSQKKKMEDGSRHNKSESASKKLITSSDSGYDEERKRKHKGSSNRHEVTSDDDSLDTDDDETKDAKRRKKEEEKISRREKRRQRHEEKRRKKEERRSKKYKSREDSSIVKKVHDKSDVEEEEEEKKKQLEIALRKKALESLKAKKGVGQ